MSGAPPPSSNRQSSRLYLSLYFPEWSIDVTRRKLRLSKKTPEPTAVVLTTSHAQHTVVSRTCSAARRAGVQPMMALQLARALLPFEGVHYAAFDPIRDIEALHTLAVWCLRFSPCVGLDSELHNARLSHNTASVSPQHYGIVIDLTGTKRLHGDYQRFAHSLNVLFKEAARIAITPTIGGAWALSRYDSLSPIIAPSLLSLRDLTSDLPIEALRIDEKSCQRLHELGIHTLEQLYELPRHSLATRFGKQVVYRLAQLLGSVDERIYSVTPRKHFHARKIFEPPLTHRHTITLAIQHLFHALVSSLHKAHTAAKMFVLTLIDTSGNAHRKELPLASATSDVQHLAAIIQPIIDGLHFCGELREISIEASQTCIIRHTQESFSSSSERDPNEVTRSYQELLNSFSVRLGKDRISFASLTNSYIPERSFLYRSALEESTDLGTSIVQESRIAYGSLERPPTLFTHPEPITTLAMLPDKPPSRIRWRNATLSIISGIGPERIAPEWWRGDLQRDIFSERDYFTIQDASGRWLWVFRDNTSQSWFMHGVWT